MIGDVLFLATVCLSFYCAYRGCRDGKEETTQRDEFHPAASTRGVDAQDEDDKVDGHPPSYATVCGSLLHGSERPQSAYGGQSDADPAQKVHLAHAS